MALCAYSSQGCERRSSPSFGGRLAVTGERIRSKRPNTCSMLSLICSNACRARYSCTALARSPLPSTVRVTSSRSSSRRARPRACSRSRMVAAVAAAPAVPCAPNSSRGSTGRLSSSISWPRLSSSLTLSSSTWATAGSSSAPVSERLTNAMRRRPGSRRSSSTKGRSSGWVQYGLPGSWPWPTSRNSAVSRTERDTTFATLAPNQPSNRPGPLGVR